MRWIGRPEKIQDRVPLNISARMDASRVLSLRVARIGGGKINVVFLDNARIKRVEIHDENGTHGGFFRLALVASTSSSWELV